MNDSEQPQELNRVRLKLEAAVKRFRDEVLQAGETDFHMHQLQEFVCRVVPDTSPDSPSRVLRLLRRAGVISYIVLNRRDSLYRFARAGELLPTNRSVTHE